MDEPRREILSTLQRGETAVAQAIHGVSEELASQKPSAGGWSIRDCVEHLAVVEQLLLRRLEGGESVAEPLRNTAREKVIVAKAGTRETKRQAPEASLPTGRFATLADAQAALAAARGQIVAWLEAHPEDQRLRLTTHPAFEGPVSCHEVLLLVGMHSVRHAGQIEEIRAGLSHSCIDASPGAP
jgi:uncharacterized damage-inducible protein DinB